MAFKLLATAALAMSATVAAAPQSVPRQADSETSLTTKIQLADTVAERYKLLENDEDFVYDFIKNPTVPFANRQTFPLLTGIGGAMAYAPLPACGMSIVHIHPRSAELFVVTEGTIVTETVLEAGTNDDGSDRSIRLTLDAGQMTVFPQGSFHTQFNPNCTPALAVASFVSDDPGFEGIIPATFSLQDQVIVNSFGDAIPAEDLEKFKASLPEGIFLVVEECMAQCSQNQTTH